MSPAPALSVTPPELPMEVADVWAEYVEAAIAAGLLQCDADTFAEWCSMTAILRRARNAISQDTEGNAVTEAAPAPASYIQQWRQLGELLGLAGAKSRSGRGGPVMPAEKANPFGRNGARGRGG